MSTESCPEPTPVIHKVVYDKRSRFPIQVAPGLCKGCQRELPKLRHHKCWCTDLCKLTYNPPDVMAAVRKRDNGTCAFCNGKTKDSPEYAKKWPKPEGFPDPNYDHIVSFADGGFTVLENMRTLCEPCHRDRTRKWYGEKKK